MNKKNRLILALIVVSIFISLILIIEFYPRKTPEFVLIRVLDDNKNPITNADCRADVSSADFFVEDKVLNEIENIYEYIIGVHVSGKNPEKGFYELETELTNQKEYEIRIVCSSPNNDYIGYTIINSTNAPCEIKDSGRILIC